MDYVKSRAENVLDTKIALIDIMKREFNLSYSELSDFLKKYSILPYIEWGYKSINSTGIKGIMIDIKDFIRKQGGDV